MPTISLCMIVKNEEEHLGRCLDSVAHLVDELIIVDTGSSDATESIITRYTDQIHHFKWINNFAAARNYAFSLATMDYLFWLDADDVLEEVDQQKFLALKNTLDPAVDSVTMIYHLGIDEFGNVTSSLRRNRLVKRSNNFQWFGRVHEYIQVSGKIINSDVAVTHHSLSHDGNRNLKIYEQQLASGEALSPRDQYYFANELRDHRMFNRAIHYYEEFLTGGKGWIEDNIGACASLADCYNRLGDGKMEIESVFRSFLYSSPRADFCCRLGYYHLHKNQYTCAIFWYKLAISVALSDTSWGHINKSCSTWLPHLQLCVCYDRLGEYQLAYQHNEEARRYRPEDKNVLENKKYLEGKYTNLKLS